MLLLKVMIGHTLWPSCYKSRFESWAVLVLIPLPKTHCISFKPLCCLCQ